MRRASARLFARSAAACACSAPGQVDRLELPHLGVEHVAPEDERVERGELPVRGAALDLGGRERGLRLVDAGDGGRESAPELLDLLPYVLDAGQAGRSASVRPSKNAATPSSPMPAIVRPRSNDGVCSAPARQRSDDLESWLTALGIADANVDRILRGCRKRRRSAGQRRDMIGRGASGVGSIVE